MRFKQFLSEGTRQTYLVWFPRKTREYKKETSAISDKEALTKLVTSLLLKKELLYQGRTYSYADRAILIKTIFDNKDWDSVTGMPKKK